MLGNIRFCSVYNKQLWRVSQWKVALLGPWQAVGKGVLLLLPVRTIHSCPHIADFSLYGLLSDLEN